MWKNSAIDVCPNPFWKFGTTSDIRNTVDVTKIQRQNAKLARVSLEFMDVLLGALDNTLDCSFAEKTSSNTRRISSSSSSGPSGYLK